MTTSATPDTPAPLDAERARLRAAGLTEDEISRIFVARELGAQPQQAGAGAPAGAAGQGVMSNVLSSIVAVGSHARAVIPSFRKDVATMFDGAATASARAGATASLAVKAVVILVLGYAAWQEWNQHIVSQTTTMRARASQAVMEQCAATATVAPVGAGYQEWLKREKERRPECFP
jgi:hypothetical protein